MTSRSYTSTNARWQSFCNTYQLQFPILMAPMAGACPPALASAISNAGGMGACGALLMNTDEIADWVNEFRSTTNGPLQLNTWIPDPEPKRNAVSEHQVREFLNQWGPNVDADQADALQPDFNAQCDAMLAANPTVISSIMGLYPEDRVQQMKQQDIHWFATVTTVSEALQAESAGADVIVAQGMEAGGHRGAFNANEASEALIGLFSLLPAIVDNVKVPVVATGGIADARQVAAAMMLGASAVQIGTGLLRTNEAGVNSAWANAIDSANPEDTITTRAYSGRLGRSIKTRYAQASAAPDSPQPAPYPIQRNLTRKMRAAATKNNAIDCMQAWAGQSARYAKAGAATNIVEDLWRASYKLLVQTPS